MASQSSGTSEPEGPKGHPRAGGGGVRGDATRPREHLQPNCPATHRNRGFSRPPGTSGCRPGSHGRLKPFPLRGTSPRAPPTQPSLQKDRRTPERAHNPKATSQGPRHATPNHKTPTGWGQAAARGTSRARPRGPTVTSGLGSTRTPRAAAGRAPPPGAPRSEQRPPQPEPAPASNLGGAARVSGRPGPLRPRRTPALCSPPPLDPPRPPPRPSRSPARAPRRPASPAAMNM